MVARLRCMYDNASMNSIRQAQQVQMVTALLGGAWSALAVESTGQLQQLQHMQHNIAGPDQHAPNWNAGAAAHAPLPPHLYALGSLLTRQQLAALQYSASGKQAAARRQ